MYQVSIFASVGNTRDSMSTGRAQKNRLKQMGRQQKERIVRRSGNGGNSLPVLSQSSRLGSSAHHPLVVDCVHGAKLQLPFSVQ
jgi:hypothetical protein